MRLVSNIAFMWLMRLMALGSSAILSIVTARALGPAGRGAFSLPAIDVSIANTLSVGLSSAASYFLLNRKAGPQIVRALAYGLVVFVITGSLVTTLSALISHSLWATVPALVYMVCYASYSVVCGYYFGRDRARTAGVINGALGVVTLIFVSTAMLGLPRLPLTAIIAWVAAIALVATVGVVMVVADSRRLEGGPVDPLALIAFGAKAGILNVANLLNYRVDIFVVAMLLPVATVGLYTIAVTGAESALSVTLAVGQATLSRFGSLEHAEAGAFAARCIRNSIFCAAILCLSGTLLAPVVIGVLFGHAYISLVTPMRVLLLGIVAASTASIVSNYFVLNLGRARPPLLTSLFSTVLCAAMSFALVPRLGMLGAALASTIAYALSQAFAILFFCKVSGIGVAQVIFVNRRDLAQYATLLRRFIRIA